MEENTPSAAGAHRSAYPVSPVTRGLLSAALLWVAAAMASVACFEADLAPRPYEELLIQEPAPHEAQPEPKRESDWGNAYARSLV